MKWTRGRLGAVFLAAAASIGYLATNTPDINHEPVRLTEQQGETPQSAMSIFRAGGGTADTSSPVYAQPVEDTASAEPGTNVYKNLTHIGRVMIDEAMKPETSSLERLQYLSRALNAAHHPDISVIADRLGMKPGELVSFMRQKAVEAIGELRTEMAAQKDDALSMLVKWDAIEKGTELAGLQANGRINRTYGEQMTGLSMGETQAQKQQLYAGALEAGRKQYNEPPKEFGTMSLRQVDSFVTVAGLLTDAYRNSPPPPPSGAFISVDELWIDTLAERGGEARKFQMSAWEKISSNARQIAAPSGHKSANAKPS